MLVLSRKKQAEIVVTVPPSAEPVTISLVVVEIRGEVVRLGVKAPRHVAVDRAEVAAAKARREGCQCMEHLGPHYRELWQHGATQWKCPKCGTVWRIDGDDPKPTAGGAG